MSAEPTRPVNRRAFLSGMAGGVAAALGGPCCPEAAAFPTAAIAQRAGAQGNRPSAEELARARGQVVEVSSAAPAWRWRRVVDGQGLTMES